MSFSVCSTIKVLTQAGKLEVNHDSFSHSKYSTHPQFRSCLPESASGTPLFSHFSGYHSGASLHPLTWPAHGALLSGRWACSQSFPPAPASFLSITRQRRSSPKPLPRFLLRLQWSPVPHPAHLFLLPDVLLLLFYSCLNPPISRQALVTGS